MNRNTSVKEELIAKKKMGDNLILDEVEDEQNIGG